jgi:5-methylcytosine-specific restriction endonuclease McrA
MRAWRAANRERAREIDRRSKEKNAAAIKETKKRCYIKHREANLVYAAQYRAEHGDEIRAKLRGGKNTEYARRYRERHYEECRARTQAWKDANVDRRRLTQAAYLQSHLAQHRTRQHNRRCRKKNVGGTLSPDLAKRLYALQRGKCPCCGKPLGDSYDMDHIVPIALGGPNTDDNIQLLRSRCNRQKGAKHPVEFMQSRGMLL